MSDERRSYERSPIEMAASYGIPDADDITQDASLINMSGCGFCFETTKKLSKGDTLTLNIEFEKRKTANLDIKVIWIKQIKQSKNYLIGAEILKPHGKDYELFMEYYTRTSE
ncbi:MAG: PilZ domain-containing protein [Candidatus Omnitrophica bacterium]|nr:PilZ domain-containing protein [Candidatus Omnitrophota bacterium]